MSVSIYGGRGISEQLSQEDNALAVSLQERTYERGGGGFGATHGASTESILHRMDEEDMLKEVSKLPPSERKAALAEMRRAARERR